MARTKERKQEMQVATRDYTLNMHKRLQGIAFKKRATRAVRTVRRFAQKEMHTEVSTFFKSSRWDAYMLIVLYRMWEWTLNLTDSFGPEVLETFHVLSESESADRKTKTRMLSSHSTPPASSLRLSLSPSSARKKDDQSSSCKNINVELNIIIRLLIYMH